ncbi:hypothetical protein STEG23_002189, partial [Scotinomys teguina]
MCRPPWFLHPGGWSTTAVVRLYFIFPGICTLSLAGQEEQHYSEDTAIREGPCLHCACPSSSVFPGFLSFACGQHQ